MNYNSKIKSFLKSHLTKSILNFQQYSFEQRLDIELEDLKNTVYIDHPKIDMKKMQEDDKNCIIKLKNNKELNDKFNSITKALAYPIDSLAEQSLQNDLLTSLRKLNNCEKENKGHKINLLFFEHDYDFQATQCGFEDLEFKFRILSGKEYMKFNYNTQFYNSKANLNYSPFLKPVLDLEKELDEDMIHEIDEAFNGGEYLEEIRKILVLKAYLSLHKCFEISEKEIKSFEIPFDDQVFIYANEHDCEQFNIYVI